MKKLTCSKCNGPNDRLPQRYCRACHSAERRRNRPRYSELSPEVKKKANARNYTNVYIRRGVLNQQPCQECGTSERVEPHHVDYDSPLCVFWLCRPCHLAHHNNLRKEATR